MTKNIIAPNPEVCKTCTKKFSAVEKSPLPRLAKTILDSTEERAAKVLKKLGFTECVFTTRTIAERLRFPAHQTNYVLNNYGIVNLYPEQCEMMSRKDLFKKYNIDCGAVSPRGGNTYILSARIALAIATIIYERAVKYSIPSRIIKAIKLEYEPVTVSSTPALPCGKESCEMTAEIIPTPTMALPKVISGDGQVTLFTDTAEQDVVAPLIQKYISSIVSATMEDVVKKEVYRALAGIFAPAATPTI